MADSAKPEERACLYEDGLQAELIYDPSLTLPLQFAVRRDGQDSIEPILQHIPADIVPPRVLPIAQNGVVLLPSAPAEYGSQAELLAEIVGFVHKYADVPQLQEEIISHYVLMSWVYDCFTAVPYLRFLGEPGTGKSRLLQIAGQLCYRGISAGGATSSASLFRLVNLFHGTLIIDEADYRNSDVGSEIVKILNTGYMRGNPVWRCVGENFDLQGFDVYGPKVIANRERFGDHALETRCISFETQQGHLRDDIPRQVPPSFYTEAQSLRNKLLRWRFDHRDTIKPDEKPLRHLEPRLTQIGTAIYSVSDDAEFRSRFVKFLEQYAQEQREQRPEKIVVEALLHMARGGERIAVKDVAAEINRIAAEREDGFGMSAKRVGSLLRSLGFKTRKVNDGYRFVAERELLKEQAERFGLEFIPPEPASAVAGWPGA